MNTDKEFEKILEMDREIDKMYIEHLEKELYRLEVKLASLQLQLLNPHGAN